MKKTIYISLTIVLLLLTTGCQKKEKTVVTQPKETVKIDGILENAEILFISNRESKQNKKDIYSMDSEGDNIKRITFFDEEIFLIGIDKSKKNLIVTKGTQDKKNVKILDLQTKEEISLTDTDNHAEGDNFSPNGEWVVFWMIPSDEKTSDIFKIKIDGSELTRLTNTPGANEFDPSWSNHTDKIAYNYYDTKIKHFIIKMMDADGNNVRTVYDGGDGVATAIFPPGDYDPSWSQDDQWLVFERAVKFDNENGKAGVWHIFKVKTDGSGITNLSNNGNHAKAAEYLPSFSRNDKTIIFSGRHGGKDPSTVTIDIYTMDTDGKNLKNLTNSPAYDEFAIWIK